MRILRVGAQKVAILQGVCINGNEHVMIMNLIKNAVPINAQRTALSGDAIGVCERRCESVARQRYAAMSDCTLGQGSGARLRNGAQSVSDMRPTSSALTDGRSRMRAHQSPIRG